jgi:hypothetical protein
MPLRITIAILALKELDERSRYLCGLSSIPEPPAGNVAETPDRSYEQVSALQQAMRFEEVHVLFELRRDFHRR